LEALPLAKLLPDPGAFSSTSSEDFFDFRFFDILSHVISREPENSPPFFSRSQPLGEDKCKTMSLHQILKVARLRQAQEKTVLFQNLASLVQEVDLGDSTTNTSVASPASQSSSDAEFLSPKQNSNQQVIVLFPLFCSSFIDRNTPFTFSGWSVDVGRKALNASDKGFIWYSPDAFAIPFFDRFSTFEQL
jgi:hypothetical protein